MFAVGENVTTLPATGLPLTSPTNASSTSVAEPLAVTGLVTVRTPDLAGSAALAVKLITAGLPFATLWVVGPLFSVAGKLAAPPPGIRRANVRTPVTLKPRIPTSAFKTSQRQLRSRESSTRQR